MLFGKTNPSAKKPCMSRRRSSPYSYRLSLVELSSSALLWLLFSGEVAASDPSLVGAWPPQLPPGWTVEWDPSSDGEERTQ